MKNVFIRPIKNLRFLHNFVKFKIFLRKKTATFSCFLRILLVPLQKILHKKSFMNPQLRTTHFVKTSFSAHHTKLGVSVPISIEHKTLIKFQSFNPFFGFGTLCVN